VANPQPALTSGSASNKRELVSVFIFRRNVGAPLRLSNHCFRRCRFPRVRIGRACHPVFAVRELRGRACRLWFAEFLWWAHSAIALEQARLRLSRSHLQTSIHHRLQRRTTSPPSDFLTAYSSWIAMCAAVPRTKFARRWRQMPNPQPQGVHYFLGVLGLSGEVPPSGPALKFSSTVTRFFANLHKLPVIRAGPLRFVKQAARARRSGFPFAPRRAGWPRLLPRFVGD
jgi:hypothetical protein